MSDGQMNRRGLLGLLAVAPIAAAVKPAAALEQTMVVGLDLGSLEYQSGWVITEGEDFSLIDGPVGRRIATLNPKTVDQLAALPIEDRPQGLSSHADGERPGAPARGNGDYAPAANSIPSGAPGPDLPSDHPILIEARAC